VSHVLAIDEGTTGVTCLMVASDGSIAGRGYREITQYFPRSGWVEHDPANILERTLEAARDAITSSGVEPAAIGITNQRETIVLWDRATGVPVHRAIVWQDRRTTERCASLVDESKWIAERTGLVVDPYFSATKLEWLLRQPGVAGAARAGRLAAGTVDSWLIWSLTGGAVHATDPTNASRTMLFDIDRLAWSDELCDLFDVPRTLLPEVRASSGSFGQARGPLLGLRSEVPILGVAGDQQAALFGQGCWNIGSGKNTYGTGAFLLLNTGSARANAGGGLLTTVACDAAGKPAYALEGAIFIAGAAIQWLRDGLGVLDSAGDSERLAREIPSTGGVYFVPALAGLGAPHWEPAARGTIVGLTQGTSVSHLVRAALEAMAYRTADVIALMTGRSGAPFSVLRVDGGASANDWLMQFQADVLSLPVERPAMIESTALGAAGLAGIAAGTWRSADEFLATRDYRRFTPGEGAGAAREGAGEWNRAVKTALHWARTPV